MLPPLSLSGLLPTIRKFPKRRLRSDDLVRLGTMTPETADFLDRCVRARLNVLISGGTSSGKTTLLNIMSGSVPEDDRVVTIEETAKLQLHQRRVLRLESRIANVEGEGAVSIRELVRNSLRMRPDWIIVGEVRGAEALAIEQALQNMLDRCPAPAVRAFVRAVIQGESLGTSIDQVMRELARDLRTRRRQIIEEKAQKAPIKMLFPLVFRILPAIFVVVLFPGLYEIVQTLGD